MSTTKKQKKQKKSKNKKNKSNNNNNLMKIYYSEFMLIFLNIFQLYKLMEKADRDLLFEEKRQEALDKKLGCKFIGISTSKHFDEDYEIGIMQTFISKFKNRQSRKLEKE